MTDDSLHNDEDERAEQLAKLHEKVMASSAGAPDDADSKKDSETLAAEAKSAEDLFRLIERVRAREAANSDAFEAAANGTSADENLSDYEIIDEIARGGMGVVYHARQISLNREVALKTILGAKLSSPEQLIRFRVEAEAVAKLDHPNIVPIYEVGEVDGMQFFSMGLFSNGSLVERWGRTRPTANEAAKTTAMIAEAIQYAHSRNVVHRDLKPANVLLDDLDKPRVSDFGLAKDADHDSELTMTGAIIGTPSFMPPEQAAGNLDEVGPLADVYGIGGILYFLLTGEPPFDGKTAVETITHVIEKEPVHPRQLESNSDIDLSTIALKCLEKNPSRRYASAGEIADDLHRWLRDEPIIARPVSSFERASKWTKRNPILASFVALSFAAIMIALIGGVIYQWQLSEALAETELAREQATESEKNTTNVFYESLTDQAEFLTQARPAGYGRLAWSLVQQANELDTELRDEYQLRRLATLSLGHYSSAPVESYDGFEGDIHFVELSYDQRFLLVGLENGELHILDRTRKLEPQVFRELAPDGVGISSIHCPRPNELIATLGFCWKTARYRCDDRGTWSFVENVDTQRAHEMFDIRFVPGGDSIIGWAPMTQDIVKRATMLPWTERVSRIEFNSDELPKFFVRTIGTDEPKVVELPADYSLQFDCNETLFAAGYSWDQGGDNRVHVYGLADGEKITDFVPDCGSLFSVLVSPSGRYIACTGHTGLSVHDAATGELIYRPEDLPSCSTIAFIHQDESLYVVADDVGHIICNVVTGEREVLLKESEPGWVTRMSSNREFLIRAHETRIELLRLTPTTRKEVRIGNDPVMDVGFSPDGQIFLTANEGIIRFWDSKTLTQLFELEGACACVHPSGRFLILSHQQTMQAYRLSDWQLIGSRTIEAESTSRLSFNKLGDYLAGASYNEGSFRLWKVVETLSPTDVVSRVEFEPVDVSTVPGRIPFAWSPSGRRIAWANLDGAFFSDQSDPSRAVRTPLKSSRLDSMVFLNETTIGVDSGNRYPFRIWDTEQEKYVRSSESPLPSPISLSPSSNFLVAQNTLVDIATLKPILEFPNWNPRLWALKWSPDGKQIIMCYGNGKFEIWKLEQIQQRLGEMELDIRSLRFADIPSIDSISRFVESSSSIAASRRLPKEWKRRSEELLNAESTDTKEAREKLMSAARWLVSNLPDTTELPFIANQASRSSQLESLLQCARHLSALEEIEAAEILVLAAIEEADELESPTVYQNRIAALANHQLGDLYNFRFANRKDESIRLYLREQEIRPSLQVALDDSDPLATSELTDHYWMYHNLALAYQGLGQIENAVSELDCALQIFEHDQRIMGSDFDVKPKYKQLLQWLRRLERNDEMADLIERAKSIGVDIQVPND